MRDNIRGHSELFFLKNVRAVEIIQNVPVNSPQRSSNGRRAEEWCLINGSVFSGPPHDDSICLCNLYRAKTKATIVVVTIEIPPVVKMAM
jgi:hypothetical protein